MLQCNLSGKLASFIILELLSEMKIGNLFNLLIAFILIGLTGCQKDESIEPNKKVSICPEIAMNNYDEAGLMINEFLNNQPDKGKGNTSDKLMNYLKKCDCVDSIKISSTIEYTYPAIQEYSIRFVIGKDTINKEMDVFLYNNSKLEFHKFHN
jgi:hypothetical protein